MPPLDPITWSCGRPSPEAAALQPFEIAGQQRPDIGTHGGCARALEFADLGEDLRGQIDTDPRKLLPQALTDAALVSIVEKREQKRYRDGLQAGLADRGDHGVDIALFERGHDLPLRVDPLSDLEAPAARHQYRRRLLKQIVEVGARRAAQLQHVAKAAGRNEPRPRPFLLEQRIGDDGRRVRQERNLGGIDRIAFKPLAQPVDHPLRNVPRSARDFDDADAAGFFLDQRDIGECPADIHSDPPHHLRTPHLSDRIMLPSGIWIDQQRPESWI
jgi:hypothetical protein